MDLSLFPAWCYSEAWSNMTKSAHPTHQPTFLKARIAFGCRKRLKEPNTSGRSNIHNKKIKTWLHIVQKACCVYGESERREAARTGSWTIAIACKSSTKSSAQTWKWLAGAGHQCVVLVPSDNWWCKSPDLPRSTVFRLNLDSDRATAFRTWGLGSKQGWRSC